MTMRIALAADHAGYILKDELVRWLREQGHEVNDLGTNGPESVDYPEFGAKLAQTIACGDADRGIAICGSGIGISIAVNRVPRGFFTSTLSEIDPAVDEAIHAELKREQTQIELIASENIVSKAVLEAQGSVLTNKYAEGYPGRRYYQGCEPSDAVEQLAIDRAKTLFGCGFANVQPHSGAQANGAVMLA